MLIQELTLWTDKLKEGYALGLQFYKSEKQKLPQVIKKIAFVGMGGSGIVGRLLKTFLDQQSSCPVIIVDGCLIPQSIDQDTLVIVMSYSGNTWETLMSVEQLQKRIIPFIALSHGGKLREKAFLHDFAYAQLPSSLTPRSSLGHALGFTWALFEQLGIMQGKRAFELSSKATDYLITTYQEESYFEPFVYSVDNKPFFHIWGISGFTDAVAYRAQTQFNENSKVHCVASSFPELCHNLLVGFSKPEENQLIVVFAINGMHEALTKALGVTMGLLEERGVSLYKPAILGDTLEEQLLAVILWADFASYYLARARGVDAMPVHIIDELKERHKQQNIGNQG